MATKVRNPLKFSQSYESLMVFLSVPLAAFLLLAVVLAACQPQEVEVTRVVEQEVTRVVTETITEEGETVEVTRIVTEEVVVEVPAEPEEEMMEEEEVSAEDTEAMAEEGEGERR